MTITNQKALGFQFKEYLEKTFSSANASDNSKKSIFPLDLKITDYSDINSFLCICAYAEVSDLSFLPNEPVRLHWRGRIVSGSYIPENVFEAWCRHVVGNDLAVKIPAGGGVLDLSHVTKDEDNGVWRWRTNISAIMGAGGVGKREATLRCLPKTLPTLESQGLENDIAHTALNMRDGLCYVAGVPGSGKSTLLTAILVERIQRPNQKILTFEAPIEFDLNQLNSISGSMVSQSMVSQSEVPRHVSSFAKGIHSSLRRAPTAVLVQETRDAETFAAVLESALTGVAVFSTVHGKSVFEIISRLLMLVPESLKEATAFDLITTLRILVVQRLLPTLNGGRVPVRESLLFDEALKDELASHQGKADRDALWMKILGNKMKAQGTRMIDALNKVYHDGLISKDIYEQNIIGLESIAGLDSIAGLESGLNVSKDEGVGK